MSQIDWNRVRTGLNKTVFTRHFWEGADFVFAEVCKVSKETARQVFGLTPSRGYINVRVTYDGISIDDRGIGHRAKRSILRKIGRFLRDNNYHRPKLGECDEQLRWRDEVDPFAISNVLNDARLEYLGWSIRAESGAY